MSVRHLEQRISNSCSNGLLHEGGLSDAMLWQPAPELSQESVHYLQCREQLEMCVMGWLGFFTPIQEAGVETPTIMYQTCSQYNSSLLLFILGVPFGSNRWIHRLETTVLAKSLFPTSEKVIALDALGCGQSAHMEGALGMH